MRLYSSPALGKRFFSYEEAAALLPQVQSLTESAVAEVETLGEAEVQKHEQVLRQWAAEVMRLGAEVKGLWLVDFDNGSGYYCWRHPEPSLQYFHSYEEGFGGRVRLQ